LLAEMNTSMKSMQEETKTNRKYDQEHTKKNAGSQHENHCRKMWMPTKQNAGQMEADREEMRIDQKHMQEMLAKIDANKEADREERKAERKADREDLKEMMEEMMNITLKEMRQEIKSGQTEMRSCIADMKYDRNETTSCQIKTEACLDSKELNPEDMKSEVEHREVHTEEAAVKSSATMKK
jgi:hypothetical protein